MVTSKKRILAGEEVEIQDIEGKMRLMVSGSFYTHPAIGSAYSKGEAKHLKVDSFGDGSCLAVLVKLIPSDTEESAIENMMDDALTEMETLMGFKPGEEEKLYSSSWYAGFSSTEYDAYLPNEDAAFLEAQFADVK